MPTRPKIHRPTGFVERSEARKRYDKERSATHSQKYGADWRKLRKQFLADNPLCEECYKAGMITEATIADHVIDIDDAPERRLDITNLSAKCKYHHDQKTANQHWHNKD